MEKHGVKISSLYIAQIKKMYGIIERNCYNKARDDEKNTIMFARKRTVD